MTSAQQIIYRLIGIDDASPAFEKAAASADRSGEKISKLGKVMSVVAKSTALSAVGIGVESVRAATSFQTAMEKIHTQAGGTQKDVTALSAQVLKLGTTTQQGPMELAGALYHLKSVGLDNVKAMTALKTASNLAAVGGANLEDVTNAIAGAWRSGIKGAQSFGKAAATANAIIGAGNMQMADLTAAMGTGILPAARSFGISFTSVGSALALMTDEGVGAASAATRLKMAISLMGAPSNAAEKQLESIGLTGLKLANAMRGPQGLIGAVTLLKQHLDASGLSASKQSILLSHAFGGGRSSSAILTMLNNLSVLKKKQDQINDSTSKYGGAVVAQSKTAGASFAILRSQIDTLGISIGQKLLPYLSDAAKWMVTNTPTVERVGVAFGGAAIGVTALFGAFKGVKAVEAIGLKFTGAAESVKAFSKTATDTAGIQKALDAASAGGLSRMESAQLRLTEAASGTAGAEAAFAVGAKGATSAIGDLTVAERAAAVAGAALDAVNPAVWAVGAAIGVAAVAVAISRMTGPTTDLTGRLKAQAGATGDNVAAYQKLADSLNTTAKVQAAAAKAAPAGNASGLAHLTELNDATRQINEVQKQATITAQILGGRLGTLQGQYNLTATGAQHLAVDSKANITAFGETGAAGQASFEKVEKYASGLTAAQLATYQTATASERLNNDLNKVSGTLLAGQSSALAYRQAQIEARQAIDQSTTGLKGNSAAAVEAKTAVLNSTQAAIRFAQSQNNSASGVKRATGVIQEQITWLKQHAAHSKFAAQEVDALRQALAKIKSEHATITVQASGTWHVNGGGSTVTGPSPGGTHLTNAARGLFITSGRAGVDDQLVMAQRNELIVPPNLVKAGAVDHLRGMIPGFAGGGVVGTPPKTGQFLVTQDAATLKTVEAATAKATAAGMKSAAAAAESFAGGPGGGAPSANAALARRLMPSWASGAAWAAWNAVEMREAGWNQFARNPSSGAYGIPQALPASKMGAAANPPQSNVTAQIRWMISYILGRYGSPQAAWAHEQSVGWYARGGRLPGYGGGDRRLIMAEDGEAVVDKVRTRRFAPVLSAMGVPGFATGGLVGPAAGGPIKPPGPVGGGGGTPIGGGLLDHKNSKDSKAVALAKQLLRSHDPRVLSTAIKAVRTERNQDGDLSKAPGLSAEAHKHYRELAASASKHLKRLDRDLDAVRTYRTLLRKDDKAYAADITAAKARHLPKEVARLTGLVKRGDRTIAALSYLASGAGAIPGPGQGKIGKLKGEIATGKLLMGISHSGVLNKEIYKGAAAQAQDLALAKAPGLSAAEHRHYKALATYEGKRLKVLETDRADVRAYRTSLHTEVKAYKIDLAAAKAHKLTKEAARLTRLIKTDETMVGRINMWTAGVRTFPKKKTGTGTGDGSGDDGSGGDSGSSSTSTPAPPVITATDVASTLAQFMPFATTYQFRRGTWSVPQTAPALVHQGEMVLPEHLASAVRDAIGNGTGGGDMKQVVQLLGQLVSVGQSAPAATGEHLSRVLDHKARPSAPRPRGGGGPFG